jgi:uncharacterized protein
MAFEWDDGKDAANRAKHGVSLADAVRLDWDRATVIPDHRRDYGEARQTAFAELDGRLMACAFTERGGAVRIISLRKCNNREIRKYGTSQPSTADR